jgi:hypothetical protein
MSLERTSGFDGEDKEHCPGFYLFDANLLRIEEAMQHSASVMS